MKTAPLALLVAAFATVPITAQVNDRIGLRLEVHRQDICSVDRELDRLSLQVSGTLVNRGSEPIAVCVPCIDQASVTPTTVVDGIRTTLDAQSMDVYTADVVKARASEFIVIAPGQSRTVALDTFCS